MSFPSQGYTPNVFSQNPETVIGERTGTLAANTDAFATDLSPTGLQPGEQKIFTLTICLSTSALVKVTFNGTNLCCLNDNVQINEACLYVFFIPVKEGDLFNVQIDSESPVFTLIRVGEVISA